MNHRELSRCNQLVNREFSQARILAAFFLALVVVYGFYIIYFKASLLSKGVVDFNIMALFFFVKQDILVAPLFFSVFFFRPRLASVALGFTKHEKYTLALCVGAVFLICWLGHYLVFLGYDFSRDEQMANFDADIFSHFHLFQPIQPFWRPMANALNQVYILPIGNHEDWVSFYLPVNAVFRAIVGALWSRSMTSPLLVAIGAFSIWRIAAQIWPDSQSCRFVALALYAGSSQAIITGMTAYAMSGHLALNLLWLTFFLEKKRKFDVAAIVVGFLATGLHQPIFHPLFVLPFFEIMRGERDWRRFIFYGVAYVIICLFWLVWPDWVSSFGSRSVPLSANPNGIGLVGRITHMLAMPAAPSTWLMALNLYRFFVWQHVMLLPLFVFGLTRCYKTEPVLRALAFGLFLTVVAVFILMPYQGHGWGYRYLHGLIGSACLIAVFGWRSLETHGYSFVRPMVAGTIVSVFILLPAHAVMAQHMVLPFEMISNEISQSHADVVIVDDGSAPFGQDLVLNRPDISNRPIRLKASQLTQSDMVSLYKNYKVAFLGADQMEPIRRLFGVPDYGSNDKHFDALEAYALELNRSLSQ